MKFDKEGEFQYHCKIHGQDNKRNGGGETGAKIRTRIDWRVLSVWLQQDEKGPLWAEQNAALKKLLASPEPKLTLARIDYATQGRVLDELWTHRCPGSGEVVEQLHEVTDATLEHVFHCAKLALAEGQKRRGPPTPKTLPLVIGRLAKIYEETTGERLRHTPYAKTKYEGTPQSKAGRFMAAFPSMVVCSLPCLRK